MEAALVLPDTLTIGELGPLHERLQGMLNARCELALDGSQVETIDTAGLQLLAVLCWDAAARGIGVHWCGASTQLTTNAALLGLTAVLGLDDVVPTGDPHAEPRA
jgi:anti-anti-sigma regulatory factor